MTPEKLAELRKPFPAEQVGQIPKGGVQLDYVGHADVTDRLLAVDPEWTWEPMGRTPEGLPALDGFGNLWINLTICGVTKPGVGDGKSMKECVGDALRNAAMRFGVALDLWCKGDRTFGLAGHDAPDRPQVAGPSVRERVLAAARSRFTDQAAFDADFKEQTGKDFARATDTTLGEYLAHLAPFAPETLAPQEAGTTPAPVSPGTPAGQGTDWAAIIRKRVIEEAPSKPATSRKSFLGKQLMEAAQKGVGGELVVNEADEVVPLEVLISTAMRAA